ncbi:MAG: Ig domain-containing protein [bacterium]
MKKLRLVSLILFVILAAGIAACGGNDTALTSTNSDESQLQNSNGDEDASSASESDEATTDDSSATSAKKSPVKITAKSMKTCDKGDDCKVMIYAKGGSGEYNWSLEGALPAGLDLVSVDKKTEKIDGKPSEGGTFKVTIVATDAADASNSDPHALQIEVKDASGISGKFEITLPIIGVSFADGCKEPIKIELASFGIHDLKKGEWPVQLGAADQAIRFKVSGGQAPYTWSFESKVSDSLHCHPKNPSADPSTPKGERDYRFPEDGNCGEDANAEWTKNSTWVDVDKPKDTEISLPLGGTMKIPDYAAQTAYALLPHEELNLSGAFKYNGPLPISVLEKRKAADPNVNEDPVEELTVSVTDSCDQQQKASQTLKFMLAYPSDAIDDYDIEMAYKDFWAADNDSSRLSVILVQDTSNLDMEDQKKLERNLTAFGDGNDAAAAPVNLQEIFDLTLSHAIFKLNDQPECKGEVCQASADVEKGGKFKEHVSTIYSVRRALLFWEGLYGTKQPPAPSYPGEQPGNSNSGDNHPYNNQDSPGPSGVDDPHSGSELPPSGGPGNESPNQPQAPDPCVGHVKDADGMCYPEINLLRLEINTKFWAATYDDEAGGDKFNGRITLTGTRADNLTDHDAYPGMDSADGLVFHRREMPEY